MTDKPRAESPQSLGGKARSQQLKPAQRRLIAQQAANARWAGNVPTAAYGAADKPIRIADIEVPCYVLDDGRRVITMSGMLQTLAMANGGAMVKGMNRLQLFIARDRIKPYISIELYERVRNPVRFKIGGRIAYGFDSDTLIEVAEAVIQADSAGTLQPQQAVIAHQCRVITSSLTRIGLVALIDEATGYQVKRDSDELQQILTAYLLPEHRPWLETVPVEFTNEIYRVYGWKRSPDNRGPRYAGKLIRQLIYERMPKPVLPALDEINPTNSKYQRRHRHHQFLTKTHGLDHFRTLVITIMTLLRVSRNKANFKSMLEAYFGSQLELDFES